MLDCLYFRLHFILLHYAVHRSLCLSCCTTRISCPPPAVGPGQYDTKKKKEEKLWAFIFLFLSLSTSVWAWLCLPAWVQRLKSNPVLCLWFSQWDLLKTVAVKGFPTVSASSFLVPLPMALPWNWAPVLNYLQSPVWMHHLLSTWPLIDTQSIFSMLYPLFLQWTFLRTLYLRIYLRGLIFWNVILDFCWLVKVSEKFLCLIFFLGT